MLWRGSVPVDRRLVMFCPRGLGSRKHASAAAFLTKIAYLLPLLPSGVALGGLYADIDL